MEDRKQAAVNRYFILFMAVSFLGWAVETAFFLICYGRLWDRGFMTLPFCTIYGFSFLLLYSLIGTPGADGEKGRLPRDHRWTKRSAIFYFLLSALIPTALELVTGYGFHRLFGIRLWSYAAYRFHFRGYICLEYTLLWGLLLPICMRHVFIPLKRVIFTLPSSRARPLAGSLALLSVVDWFVNFSRQELTIFTKAI